MDKQFIKQMSRRCFLGTSATAIVAGRPSKALPQAYFPEIIANQISHGTLIWTRASEAWIPYNSDSERASFQEALKKTIEQDPAILSDYPLLDRIDFADFQEAYFYGADLDAPQNYSRSPNELSVGHVGIVQIDNGISYVIEAAGPEIGVARTELTAWLSNLSSETVFWLGAFNYFNTDEIDAIVSEAFRQVQLAVPYDFFNFDLNDSSGFYCSKLIWFSTFASTKKRLDENITYILPWYSPKQMMSSPYIDVLFSPSDY